VVIRAPVSLMPDIEALVISKINELDVVPTFDQIPSTTPSEFCILHLTGGDILHRLRWYHPDIHFDVYAESKGRARLLAQTIRQQLVQNEGSRWTHTERSDITGYIGRISDAMNMQWMPDPIETPVLARYIFSLAFVCRQ